MSIPPKQTEPPMEFVLLRSSGQSWSGRGLRWKMCYSERQSGMKQIRERWRLIGSCSATIGVPRSVNRVYDNAVPVLLAVR